MDYEESLMIKIAWYYYFENMTQQSVADTLGISRMRVIKLLDRARQTGIIQFRLRKDGETRMKLERGLMERRFNPAFITSGDASEVRPEAAGLGVAMGNAQDAVKDVADEITGTNDADGVAVVVERFLQEI